MSALGTAGQVLLELAKLAPEVVEAIMAWLRGGDEHPVPTDALAQLPDTLRSEVELARLEARAKANTKA